MLDSGVRVKMLVLTVSGDKYMRISKLKSQNVKIKSVCVLNALDITIKTLRSIFSSSPHYTGWHGPDL